MDLKGKILSFSLIAAATAMISSCSNDLNQPVNNPQVDGTLRLAKDPTIMAWTGDQVLGNTYGTRTNAGDGDLNNRDLWQSYGAQELNNITDDERRGVLEAIDKKTNGTKISEDLVFPWTAYFLQDVISGQNGNFQDAGSNNGTSASYVMEVWDEGKICDPGNEYNDWGRHGYFMGWNNVTNSQDINPNYEKEHQNYTTITNSAHLNNYYLKGTTPSEQEKIEETTLLYDMKPGTYEEMKGRQFRWYINCHGNLHWSEYIIVQYEGSYYICFDFACGYPENQNIDGHNQRGCEVNDWDYNDWILKITPAGKQPDIWDGNDDVVPPVVVPEEPIIPLPGVDPEDPEDTDTPEKPDGESEVEVNLAINDYDPTHENGVESLIAKLSIHVRAATDVEIHIPIPSKALVEADDLVILEKHEELLFKHGGPKTVTFNVGGKVVTLSYETTNDEIIVTTDGIDQDVIDYCIAQHADGINFEIWTYFNDQYFEGTADKKKAALKEYLDQATIKFLDETPHYYINAFTDHGEENLGSEENPGWEWDCQVNIVDDQKEAYTAGTGKHLNASQYNRIWRHSKVDKYLEDGTNEHSHGFLRWGQSEDDKNK